MKRSEMIRRLCEDLLAMNGFINYSHDGFELPSTYEEIASGVIDYLVEQGMLPPLREATSWADLGIPEDQSEAPRFLVNKWEDE